MTTKANNAAIRHYIAVDAASDRDFLDNSVSAAEYTATSNAMKVALHYLDQATDLEEFKAALSANRLRDELADHLDAPWIKPEVSS